MRKARGFIALEAALILPVFMASFLMIIMLAGQSRAESILQYGIDQVAKEVAQYYYLAERLQVLPDSSDQAAVSEMNELIDSVFSMADTIGEAYEENSDIGSIDELVGRLDGMSEDFNEIQQEAQQLYNSIDAIASNPQGMIKLFAALLKTGASQIIPRIIAQPVCKWLVKKYIPSNGDPNEYLQNVGLENGIDSLDFSLSTFLADGHSISIVVVYQVKMELGPFKDTRYVMQSACTAAWVDWTPKAIETKFADNDMAERVLLSQHDVITTYSLPLYAEEQDFGYRYNSTPTTKIGMVNLL